VRRPQTSDDSRLCQAVSAKLEDGNLRAAIRLLVSDDTSATLSAESFDQLKQKHPQASLKAADLPSPSPTQCLSVDESQVRSGPFFHFLPALLEGLMACNHSTFATCYSLNSELNLGYLDDVTVAGLADTVSSDVAKLSKLVVQWVWC